MQPTTRGLAGSQAPRGTVTNKIALALAAIALAAAVALPRAAGPLGPSGPPGPGALVESSAPFVVDITLTGCTNVNQVTIVVPSRGTVVVTSMVRLLIDHTQGTRDMWHARHATSSTECATSPDAVNYIDALDAGVASSNSYPQSGLVNTPYEVFPGTYVFYLNVQMLLGMGLTDRVVGANTVAVFHPAP